MGDCNDPADDVFDEFLDSGAVLLPQLKSKCEGRSPKGCFFHFNFSFHLAELPHGNKNSVIFMRWRWDQGRLDYFRFDMMKRIATVLCGLENSRLDSPNDPLRSSLYAATALTFAPGDYRVWRNYKRVFGCCMLAVEVDKKMICTEICHKIAFTSANDMSADEYFGHFARSFYYPSPVFQGYTNQGIQTFPVCAILKLLLAKSRNELPAVVTIDEIVSVLVANNCTGEESINHYSKLQSRIYSPVVDEMRQIRELVRFVSQMSFLKWIEPRLYLDLDPRNKEALELIEKLAQPIRRERNPDSARELLHLSRTGASTVLPLILTPAVEGDIFFSEGKSKRVSHLRYERSPKLREMYFRGSVPPFECSMCALNTSLRYPWTENLLELHHLLPLASPLRLETQRTSLAQLVPICPTCHKATHVFYKKWLDDRHQDDFITYDEANAVYLLAKQAVITSN